MARTRWQPMTRRDKLRSEARRLVTELDAARRLVDRLAEDGRIRAVADSGGRKQRVREPIRTVHHFACTGGTLICKCIASMPNVHLISEVDPLDPQAHANPERFAPTDLVRLARLGTASASDRLVQDAFLAGLEPIHDRAQRTGLRLVLRDHAHGRFCFGCPDDGPTLRETLQERFELRSIVTVRHPLSSFVSLRENGWVHFDPATPDEYARRYEAFLDRHEGVPRFRYERIVADPKEEMQAICSALELPYRARFERTIGAHRLSGDSGRRGIEIAPRPPRPVPEDVVEQARDSTSMMRLCASLGYEDVDPRRCVEPEQDRSK